MAWQRALTVLHALSVYLLTLLSCTVMTTVGSEELPTCSFVAKVGECNLHWNISTTTSVTQIREINSTLTTITDTLAENITCINAIRPILCQQQFPNCTASNETRIESQLEECKAVATNCNELVAKVYASDVCSSIVAYSNNFCVQLNVSASSYCPAKKVYKVKAKGVKDFLRKVSQVQEKLVSSPGNNLNPCEEIYRRIHCESFVLPFNCSDEQMTKENCEGQLTCLSSNSSLNKTDLCSKFPSKADSETTVQTPTMVTHPTSHPSLSTKLPFLGNTTKTMVFFQLESIKYNTDYENKTTQLYMELAQNATDALKNAYSSLPGFIGVEILSLTCDKKVVIQHNLITQENTDKPSLDAIKARLTIASESGFLKGRIVLSTISDSCEKLSSHDHKDNWVYMIVFVCITALLLLAMVLCNQSS